jgi:cytochrome P450
MTARTSRPGPECALIDFDQHSLDYRNRWREISDTNLRSCPVAWTPAHGGYWVVSGYAPLKKVTHDPQTFSSRWDLGSIRQGPGGISIPPGPYPKIPAELDPPEFLPYRRLISQDLSPEKSERWEPFIRQTVATCLDRAVASGQIDLVFDLASPLATAVVLGVLGLPIDGCAELARAIHITEFTKPGMPDFEASATVMADLAPVIEAQIASRRREPANDLISKLAHCLIDGEPIPVERIVGICYLVLGSVDNTAGFIASTLHWLHGLPERRRMLMDDPGLIPVAIEELLRYLAPIHGLARTATRDIEMSGQRIRAGDRLWLHFAAANRDPAVFENPDAVRFDRSPNRHASFGFGIHRCVGAPLTRLQAKVTVEMVLARLPDYLINLADTSRYEDVGKFNGFKRMPTTIPAPSA